MKHFSIVKKAKVFFSISLIFLLVGVVSMLTRGFNLGIDFTGGSIIDVKFENPVTVSEVRDVLSDHKLGSSIIQLGSMDGQQTEESQSVLIRTGIISDDQRVETMTDMTNRLGPNEVLRVENVGATVGRDLVKSAMGAVALSWVLMMDNSIWQTMNRSIYTSATTLFAVIAIFLFGGETIRNFSFAMLVGFSSGFYTSTFLAGPLWIKLRSRGTHK